MRTQSKHVPRLVGLVAVALVVVVSACGADYNDAYSADNPPTLDEAARPYEVFLAAGCAACHGANAEGDIGPALAGHSEGQVWRQVRAPLGAMPVFSPTDLPDESVAEIIKYIQSLGPEGTEMEMVGALQPGELAQMHHLMALGSLASDSPDAADHHLEHLLELVSGEHAALLREARAEIAAGNLKDAEHIVEQMTLLAIPDIEAWELHLRLALQSVAQSEADIAADHVEHAGETLDDDRLADVSAALAAGNWSRAESLLLDILPEGSADGMTSMGGG